jgi:hypothetical protein
VRLAKLAVLLSTAWTILCAALIAGLQAISWIHGGAWDEYSFSTMVKALSGEPAGKYTTAGFRGVESEPTIIQTFSRWLLEIPVVVPLLFVAVLLWSFYRWLATVERSSRS